MKDLLGCYDGGLAAFAEIAGDFDFLSTQERESWLARQWVRVADGGGWRAELDRILGKLIRSQQGLVSIESSALVAFTSFVRREREHAAHADRATARAQVMLALKKRNPAALWRVELDVGSLPAGACYSHEQRKPPPMGLVLALNKLDQGPVLAPKPKGESDPPNDLDQDPKGEVTVLPERAFLADSGPSYFWSPTPTTLLHHLGCGWETPLRLSLGTFPWVYGDRLQAPAPGLSWRSNSTQHPAPLALRIAVGFWHPEGNLDADAREVAAAWKHWRVTTEPLVAALPTWPAVAPEIGAVYRDGEFLHVHEASESSAGLNGPRGFVCAAAYNHIQSCFAAFFAMRRALLRAHKHLTPELRKALLANPDPCVRQQLGVASLTLA